MGQWTPTDSLACSIGHLDKTNSSGIWEARVGLWIPMDCPTSLMGQWDRTDSGVWGAQVGHYMQTLIDHPTCCMVEFVICWYNFCLLHFIIELYSSNFGRLTL